MKNTRTSNGIIERFIKYLEEGNPSFECTVSITLLSNTIHYGVCESTRTLEDEEFLCGFKPRRDMIHECFSVNSEQSVQEAFDKWSKYIEEERQEGQKEPDVKICKKCEARADKIKFFELARESHCMSL